MRELVEWAGYLLNQRANQAILLLSLCSIALRVVQAGFKDTDNPWKLTRPHDASLVLVNAVKTVASFALGCAAATATPPWHEDTEPGTGIASIGRREVAALLGLSALQVLTSVVNPTPFADNRTIRVMDTLSLVTFVALLTYLVFARCLKHQQYTNNVLQVTAIFLGERFVAFKGYNAATYSYLLLSNLLSAITLLSIAFVYQSHHRISIHRMNVVLFSGMVVLHALLQFSRGTTHTKEFPFGFRDVFATGAAVLLQAGKGIAEVAVLRYASPMTYCTTMLFSTSMIAPLSFLVFGMSDGFDLIKWIAAALAIYAAASHVFAPSADHHKLEVNHGGNSAIPQLWPPRRRAFAALVVLMTPLAVAIWRLPLVRLSHDKNYVWRGSQLGEKPPMPHQLLPPSTLGACTRNPLPPTSAWVGPGTRPDDFHAFDNVLLVVFFSHPRYDVNMDGYREVYSCYFPNILFVGPASREDRGFLHSYDVLVDSYKGEEDFHSGWLKMAGRVAHHMLYSAVKDHPCYDGYLWAPFDALLNVPRLSKYPQDHIWYHSPYGKPQHNVALTAEKAKHAPAAEVSTKTPDEYASEQAGWGVKWKGWFWEPHQGLKACMPAYDKMPERMRDRLTELTGGPERFLLGSADTAYIPGALRTDLLDALGTFLQTDCFLEIALPTALHLISPPSQDIVFVDHFWSNEPPFDVSFIRDKWANDYEVDSFHTFHWGDPHSDGTWRANENSVDEVRALLDESFKRQKMR